MEILDKKPFTLTPEYCFYGKNAYTKTWLDKKKWVIDERDWKNRSNLERIIRIANWCDEQVDQGLFKSRKDCCIYLGHLFTKNYMIENEMIVEKDWDNPSLIMKAIYYNVLITNDPDYYKDGDGDDPVLAGDYRYYDEC